MTVRSHSRRPSNLLRELGISEPEDIRIEAIAEYCNATVVYEPLEGSAARLLGYGDRAFISVDSKSRRERQRFSAGHELGHWMMDRGKIASFICAERVFATEWNNEIPEYRANRYATELLLPEFMFVPRAKNREITFATVRELATAFEMSLTATAIRLVDLGSFPAMLVCSEPSHRIWFKAGPDIPKSLWARDKPGAYTAAYDLLHGNTNPNGPIDVDADGWINHPEARRYTLREDSIRISSEMVLSLIWWKDERQLLDLESDED